MPVSCPVVQFMVVCRPNGNVFPRMMICTLLSFGDTIGGLAKKKETKKKKTRRGKNGRCGPMVVSC